MDPKATMIECAAAIHDGDIEAAREYLSAYRRWRAADGFNPAMPDGTTGDDWAARASRALA